MISGGFAQPSGLIDSLMCEINSQKLDEKEKTKLLLNICYQNFQDPNTALVFGKQALELAKEGGYKEFEAYANSYIGENEKFLGNRISSIKYFVESARIFRELGKYNLEANILISIAGLFIDERDFGNAINYYNQGLNIFQSCQDTFYVASTLINIGEAYRIFNNSDSAVYYYNQGIESMRSIKDETLFPKILKNEATVNGNLGMIYLQMGDVNKAKQNLLKAIKYFSSNFEALRTSVYQCEMGKLLIYEGKIDEGEDLIKKSLHIAKVAKLKEQIRDISFELSSFYENRNLPEKALFYHKQYKVYDDSLKNVENVRKMEKLQSQFHLNQKEEEIAVLNKINRLQRGLGYAMMGGAFILIIFFFVLFQSNRKIKLQNKKISEQNLIVEQREQEKALLLKELNHRVKNNLQMVASLLNLHSRQLKDHPAAEALMEGKYRVEALTLIHQKLYRDDVDTKINIKDYIEELVQNLVLNFGQKFKLSLNLESFAMKIDKAIPLGLIINELLTNSLKYGHENNDSPLLHVGVKKVHKKLIIIIKDNGSGLPSDFDIKMTESFGLKLVHSLVKQLGGVIEWKAENGTQWKLALDTLKIS